MMRCPSGFLSVTSVFFFGWAFSFFEPRSHYIAHVGFKPLGLSDPRPLGS